MHEAKHQSQLEIRSFDPSDAAGVWALHNKALEGTGSIELRLFAGEYVHEDDGFHGISL